MAIQGIFTLIAVMIVIKWLADNEKELPILAKKLKGWVGSLKEHEAYAVLIITWLIISWFCWRI